MLARVNAMSTNHKHLAHAFLRLQYGQFVFDISGKLEYEVAQNFALMSQ